MRTFGVRRPKWSGDGVVDKLVSYGGRLRSQAEAAILGDCLFLVCSGVVYGGKDGEEKRLPDVRSDNLKKPSAHFHAKLSSASRRCDSHLDRWEKLMSVPHAFFLVNNNVALSTTWDVSQAEDVDHK